MAENLTTSIPMPITPVVMSNGQMDPVWWQFFLKIFQRTGGAPNTPPDPGPVIVAGNAQVVDTAGVMFAALMERLAYLESMVASMQPFIVRDRARLPEEVGVHIQCVQNESAFLNPHGVHDDETLHALATTTTAGFMSAADKIKLDSL